MIIFMKNLVALLLLSALLSSCSGLQNRHDTALAIASGGGLTPQVLDTGQFRLTLFYRGLAQHSSTIAIYIEGDGHAWKQKHVLSDDPTPIDPVALKLAATDPSPAALYIARPCQYLKDEDPQACGSRYWSSHRFAEEVIRSVNKAVDWGVRKSGAAKVYIYGYSGGGAVAALVTAMRTDVAGLTTIAAPLDHAYWTRLQGISPLSASLNPADATDHLQYIPQVHFAGSEDKVVPVSILESYQERFKDRTNITLRVIPGFDHHCCWADAWPGLLLQAGPNAAAR